MNSVEFETIYSEAPRDYDSLENILQNNHPSGKDFDEADLATIQSLFHNLMYFVSRNEKEHLLWLDDHVGILPLITNELVENPRVEWFPVVAMNGGFSYALIERDGKPLLMVTCAIKAAGSHVTTYEVTPSNVTLTARLVQRAAS